MAQSEYGATSANLGAWRLFFRLYLSGLVCALVAVGCCMWFSLNADANSVSYYNEPNFETACLMMILGAPMIVLWQSLPVALMAGAATASVLRSGCAELNAILLTTPFATLLAWIPKLAGLDIESDYWEFLALEGAAGVGLWAAAKYFSWPRHASPVRIGDRNPATL
jgi:hypothetical protein